MKKQFDKCLKLSRKIVDIDEEIIELKTMVMSPKNQAITDMPRGGGVANAIENYLIRLEKLERKKSNAEIERNQLWKEIKEICLASGVCEEETIRLLKERFYCGKSWNKCLNKMIKEYPNSRWNINKCFRVYRAVLCKIHKMEE